MTTTSSELLSTNKAIIPTEESAISMGYIFHAESMVLPSFKWILLAQKNTHNAT